MPLMKGKSDKAFKHNVKTEYEEGKPLKQSLAIAYSMKRKGKKMADGGSVGMPQKVQSAQDSMRKAFHYADGGSCPSCGYASGGGVHEPVNKMHPDMSRAGLHARVAKDLRGTASGAMAKEASKQSHEMALSEMKKMSPKLKGLAHGGQITDNYQSPNKVDTKPDLSYHEMDSGYHDMPMNKVKSNGEAMSEDDKDLNQHGESDHGPMMGGQGFHGESYMGTGLVDRILAKKLNMQGKPEHEEEQHYSEGGKVANDTHPFEADFNSPNEFDDLVLRDDLSSSYGEDDNAGDALGNAQQDDDRSDIIARIMASRKKKDRNPRPA